MLVFKVDVLQSVVVRAGQNSKAAGVRWLLQQESNTWRLITSLYRYLPACLTGHVCVPVYLRLNGSSVCLCRDRVQVAIEDDVMDMVVSDNCICPVVGRKLSLFPAHSSNMIVD